MWQKLRSLAAVVSLMSTIAAGLLGVVVMQAVGPFLAMGLQIWSGNTEPSRPHLPFPVVPLFVALLLPVPWIRQRRWPAASIAAIPLAILPFYQLLRLYGAAAS